MRFKQCFVRQVFRFYTGRDETPADDSVLRQMFSAMPGRVLWTPWHFGLAGIALVVAAGEEWSGWTERILRPVNWRYATAMLLMFACLEFFAVIDVSVPFIYFQF